MIWLDVFIPMVEAAYEPVARQLKTVYSIRARFREACRLTPRLLRVQARRSFRLGPAGACGRPSRGTATTFGIGLKAPRSRGKFELRNANPFQMLRIVQQHAAHEQRGEARAGARAACKERPLADEPWWARDMGWDVKFRNSYAEPTWGSKQRKSSTRCVAGRTKLLQHRWVRRALQCWIDKTKQIAGSFYGEVMQRVCI